MNEKYMSNELSILKPLSLMHTSRGISDENIRFFVESTYLALHHVYAKRVKRTHQAF